MKKIELIFKSTLAGVLIGLAACIFAGCSSLVAAPWGKVLGAGLFSIGLISVIFLEAFLFTGKIGYVNSKEKIVDVIIGLLFNLLSAFIVGLIYRFTVGTQVLMDSRLNKEWYRLLVDGIGCGALIYLAVELYKKKQNILCIILPVIAFILSGMEHSIADAAYYGMCELSWEGLIDIGIIIVGNTIGSLLVRVLQIGINKKKSLD